LRTRRHAYRPGQAAASGSTGSALATALAFFGSLVVFALFWKIVWAILAVDVVLSAVTVLAYRSDKAAAQQGRWRTQESALHLLSLMGGWPGALIAQQRYHHKTRKQPFRTIFWLTVVANLGALAWLLSAVVSAAFPG